MNKRGQALIEFIIILPVIIYVIMFLVDVMVIFSKKNSIEADMVEVVSLYRDNNIEEIKKFNNNFEYKVDGKYSYLKIYYDYKPITPGLSHVIGNPYKIECERVVLNEQ